ncbi:Bro-N domain-containing protein [Streptomyces sp. AV19]|nr:Bro-N domain-containing protein [Streptomyces sp. AV19]MBH1933234.1 Bro-N domain-containing protein [Streptomyces sp. AV19]MDG4530666.1 Bro-N domain-containing protein [Streptomyces sp. AV19]
MSAQNMPPDQSAATAQDAIDVNDFVYAATAARVRRLTTPDGNHWFPAADVAGELGYANTRDAIARHVPERHWMGLEDLARTVGGRDASRKFAGHGLKRSMRMVNLQGLVRLVNACTKPEAEPFKQWVTEVVVAVQRDGSYSLDKAAAQPSATTAYAVPEQIAEAIARAEERNLRLIEGLADALNRLATRVEEIADRLPAARRTPPPRPRVTAESVLRDWKKHNLVITEDIWAVGAYVLPAIIEHGEACYPLDAIAARTGLTVHRVHDSLRMMLKRGCIRQTGTLPDGSPIYALK